MLQRRITNITYTCTLVHPTQSLLQLSHMLLHVKLVQYYKYHRHQGKNSKYISTCTQIHHRVIFDFSDTELHIQCL